MSAAAPAAPMIIPMPMPMGMDKWFPVLGTAIPGMETAMTMMMKQKIKKKGVASIEELRDLCIEAEVKLIGCQMTIDLFDMKREDFIDDLVDIITVGDMYALAAGESTQIIFI